jgi:hypothetical protein
MFSRLELSEEVCPVGEILVVLNWFIAIIYTLGVFEGKRAGVVAGPAG